MKSPHKTLDHVDANIDPRSFFKKYVATRTPVIIKGLLNDSTFKANRWTDLDYLSVKAGHVEVMVEPMHPGSRQFGTDIERIKMPFREFIDSLGTEQGKNHYLTTQYVEDEEAGDGGETSVVTYPPPTNALKDEFPSAPSLMGNLVLQQVNLWMGKSEHGSSSGLHHDFHDNMYCLLLGHKRFVLFPPQDAHNLYPHGHLHTVHPNGLISYAHNILRADCLKAQEAARFRVQAVEKKMESAKGKEKAKLEKLHNDALEVMMDFLVEDGDGDDDFADIDLGLEGDSEIDSEDEEADEGDGDSKSAASVRKGKQITTEDEHEDGEPSSFSRIPTAVLHKHLDLPTTAALPSSMTSYDLTDLRAPFVVHLNPGEMLYLPASWWHEVTSSSADSSKDHIHMAFNYWFYPPDGLKRFEEPYEDDLIWGYLRSQLKASEKKSEKRKRDSAGGSTECSKKSRKQTSM